VTDVFVVPSEYINVQGENPVKSTLAWTVAPAQIAYEPLIAAVGTSHWLDKHKLKEL
jgi:hypothetical protein